MSIYKIDGVNQKTGQPASVNVRATSEAEAMSQAKSFDLDVNKIALVPKELADRYPITEPLASAPASNSQLTQCPDCGKQISKRATACPNCGAPIKTVIDRNNDIDRAAVIKRHRSAMFGFFVLYLLFALWFIWLAATRPITGGVVVIFLLAVIFRIIDTVYIYKLDKEIESGAWAILVTLISLFVPFGLVAVVLILSIKSSLIGEPAPNT